MTTTNLGLTELLEAQSNKVVTVNEVFEAIDAAMTHATSIDVGATADTAGILLTQTILASGIFFTLDSSAADGAFIVRLPALERLFAVQNNSGFAATFQVDPAEDGADGTTVVVADATTAILYSDGTNVIGLAGPSGATAFTELSDVPASFSGQALKLVRVNAGATALEFQDDNVLAVATDATTNKNSALTDRYVRMTNAGANTYTVMANATIAHPIGATITVTQAGAGTTTITPDTGVTINSRGALVATAGQFAIVTLVKVATDEWDLTGDLA